MAVHLAYRLDRLCWLLVTYKKPPTLTFSNLQKPRVASGMGSIRNIEAAAAAFIAPWSQSIFGGQRVSPAPSWVAGRGRRTGDMAIMTLEYAERFLAGFCHSCFGGSLTCQSFVPWSPLLSCS
jgi:hypothetical protein